MLVWVRSLTCGEKEPGRASPLADVLDARGHGSLDSWRSTLKYSA
jgi:hypothetical protein